MADKYVSVTAAGLKQEVEATVTSTGAAQAGDIVALDAGGKLDGSVLPTGVGADTKVANAGDTLGAGDFVYIDATGDVRLADASTAGKEAQGFVLSAFTAATNATVYFEGTNNALSGLTVGSRYYLGTTAGSVTTTAPTASGEVVQYVGRATSATELAFEPAEGVARA